MNRILIILLLLIPILIKATPGYIWRVNNSTQIFGSNLSIGTTIIDLSTGTSYVTLKAVESTKSISTCIIGRDLNKTDIDYITLSIMLLGNDTSEVITAEKLNDYLEIREVVW